MKSTPSFITEIPLKTSSFEEAILKKRFWAARQQYNALLGECLKRLKNMITDARYSEAKLLFKKKETRQKSKEIFRSLAKEYKYREYDLSAYTNKWNKRNPKTNKRNSLSIGAALSQKLAKRVFEACEKYRTYKPTKKEDWGKNKGKPRFKGYRGLHSIEDKQPTTLKIKENYLEYLGLKILLLVDLTDPVHHHCFDSKLKYVRLVRRQFNKNTRYFVQLVCEGKPLIKSKHLPQEGTIGLDVGPQTIAIVSKEKEYASLEVFADGLKNQLQEKQKYQRKQSRQERLNNPSCFETDSWEKKDKYFKKKKGKNKKGKRLVTISNSLRRTRRKLKELSRRESSTRKSLHGNLVNKILQQGTIIKTEKISYKWYQSVHGKSVGFRAPGKFLEILRRKAVNAGGKVEEINTHETKLSQVCHCGSSKKKSLSTRWHICDCGVKCQRDLYSAYLCMFVENNKLIADQAKLGWSGKDVVLCAAMSNLKQSKSMDSVPSSLGLSQMKKAKSSGVETVAYAVS